MRRWEVIEALVKEHGWTRGAELGVFEGETFFHLLDSCPGLKLIGVDAWLPGDPDYAAEVTTLAEAYAGRAQILRMTTTEASYQIDDGALDFVVAVDDHTEAGVTEDIQTWLPKIRLGGWLLGYEADLPAVRRAIDDVLPGWQSHDDSVWAWPVYGET